MVDLREQLRRQLNFIITSCHAYDAGELAEALRVATAARVLFHDTSNSRSLVAGHLQAGNIRLRSTCSDITCATGQFLGFMGLEASTGLFPTAPRRRRQG